MQLQLPSIARSHCFHLQPEDAPFSGDKGPTQQLSSYKNIINYGGLQCVNLCFRNLPPGIQADMVFSDMKYLLELLEPSEHNQTKFLRLQSILDYNNITVETVMRRVSCISTILYYVSFRVAVFMCSLQNNAQEKRLLDAANLFPDWFWSQLSVLPIGTWISSCDNKGVGAWK